MLYDNNDFLVSINSTGIVRYTVSFANQEISEPQYSDYGEGLELNSPGAILPDGTVMMVDEAGRIDYFPLTDGDAENVRIGVPVQFKHERLNGLAPASDGNHLWTVREDNSTTQTLLKLAPDGTELLNIPIPGEEIYNCDVLELENGTVVRSFAKGGSPNADSIGYQLFSLEGELIDEYLNTDLRINPGQTQTFLRPLSDNGFAMLHTSDFCCGSDLLLKSENDPQVIIYDVTQAINLRFATRADNNAFCFVGTNTSNFSVLPVYEIDLTGQLNWSTNIEIDSDEAVSAYGIASDPAGTAYAVALSHISPIEEGYGLQLFLLDNEGQILQEIELETHR